jgi:hypothetical protein
MFVSLQLFAAVVCATLVVASPGGKPSANYKRSGATPSPVYARANNHWPKPSAVYARAEKPGPSAVYHKRDDTRPRPSPLYNRAEKPAHPRADAHPSPVYGRANKEPKPSAVYLDYTKREAEPEASSEYHKKRLLSEQILSQSLCPEGLMACPVDSMAFIPDTLHDWEQIPYECVEVDNDLNSCGGCSTFDKKYVSGLA